ncbi:hypothetical protein Sps_02325 [Shewanella psychrophila]|uniref:Uncharacterized protein n=1 Tax=Shewanella psychrophila TaxID=225848 RepID=A0A1S6HPN3_9GAMM|nr:hypothetical protein [Shewanella psychrophila]AQS37483.1 hypothetical protein Sps_02325 [Shewanella psychrophila]
MKYSLLSAALLVGFVQVVSAHSTSVLSTSEQSTSVSAEQAQQPRSIEPATKLELVCTGVMPHQLSATYEVSQTRGVHVTKHQLQLTRYQDTAIYQRSPQSFEAWQHNGEYVRYFPMDKRSVSYRPSDLLSLNISYDLEQVFHLVSPQIRSKLKQADNIQHTCLTVESFRGELKGQEVSLQWATSLDLPYQLTIGQGDQQLTYQLAEVKPVTQADFKALTTGYKDIDFADVGDSESDPFIAKMITQGFIQHGSSGFYTSDGQQITGNGHSSHSH